MSKQRIRVTITDSKLIPTIGKGPINRPISITVGQYELLTKLGFNVVRYEEEKPQKIQEQPKPQVEESVEEQEVSVEDPKESQEEETLVEEQEVSVEDPKESQEEETLVEEQEEISEEELEEIDSDIAYTMEDLEEATKKELKEILDSRGVNYGYNDTLSKLKDAVIESNPEK
ncbi:hypothetical protein AR9_g163 [Bacillus phage AR9]|uniref:Uncharacterized protein n=1 Tax=Bacillus phage AR9 TaxID=1815509 RepID=A0A172JI72_BPPB1|nr:hypothetical protein BI022_gp162 [Bacillus phage AR9]AMS01247.1 hypothetical protein AR9_g163 [Bacillus phage AR9]